MAESADQDLLTGLALRQVAERYAAAVDRNDGDAFAAQFVEDGVLEAPRGRFVGRAELSTIPALVRRHYRKTFHAVLNQLADVSGDRARAETYGIARHFFSDEAGQPLCYEMTIRYQDEFAREALGWLLARRALVLDATQTFRVDAAPR
jgi:hypothetical protein